MNTSSVRCDILFIESYDESYVTVISVKPTHAYKDIIIIFTVGLRIDSLMGSI